MIVLDPWFRQTYSKQTGSNKLALAGAQRKNVHICDNIDSPSCAEILGTERMARDKV